jgi:predicted nucleic acid-binding protein
VSELVVDTSIWIDFFRGVPLPDLEEALQAGLVLLPPVVAAELLSAPLSANERRKLTDFVRDLPLCESSLPHWIAVGALRATLAKRGFSVSTPDAHVAQCALDAGARLWSRDAIFNPVATCTTLRLFVG